MVIKYIAIVVILTGFLGIFLHLQNNLEFEREMKPHLPTLVLLKRAFTGALPVMAPGVLIPVGMLGLLVLNLRIPFKKLNVK